MTSNSYWNTPSRRSSICTIPATRHDTHVATFLRCLEALRALPPEMRPQKVYGCEVWRKLDWPVNDDKVMLWVDKHPHMLRPLLGVFDSQISGGKRYDLAEEGLRHANATYFDSHTTDKTSLLSLRSRSHPTHRGRPTGCGGIHPRLRAPSGARRGRKAEALSIKTSGIDS